MKNKENSNKKDKEHQEKDKEQNFIIDKKVLEKEVSIADISKNEKILEIGSGDGRLTRYLAERAGFVLAFEKDLTLKEQLDKNISKLKNIQIIYDDALKYSWKNVDKIVSNIPYSLSWPIIEKAIYDNIKEMTLIVGEKFKKKLEDQQKTGLISNLFFDIEFISKIDRDKFYPIPKTDSWLIRFKKKNNEKEFVKRNLSRIFLSRRKIKNAIIYSLLKEGFTKKEIKKLIKDSNLNKYSLEKNSADMTGKLLLTIRKFFDEIKQKNKTNLQNDI